jgi:hypothetical protein
MMKKTILLNLLMLLFIVSCSSDSGNDDLKKDELLSNTEWVYIDNSPSDQITEEIVWNNGDFNKFLASLLYRFPSFAINTVTIDYVELNEEKSTIKSAINEGKLRFTNTQCIYTKLKQNTVTIQTVKNKYKRMTIPSQECTNERGDILKILPNGIYVTEKATDFPEEKRLIELVNNQYKEFSNLIEIISEKESTEIKENTSLTFSFIRTENEIIMTNSSYKWFGILNKNNWTISAEQISPEKQEIGMFSLLK